MAAAQWRPDSPVELPNRTLRCKAHFLEICNICNVDYTFMRDLLADGDIDYTALDDDDDDNDDIGEYEDDEDSFGVNGEREVRPYLGVVSVPPKSHVPREDMPIERSRRPLTWSHTRRPAITQPSRLFVPPDPSAHPTSLFVPQSSFTHNPRFVRRANFQEVLLYVAGTCLCPNALDAQGGCAFVYHPSYPQANVRFRLEPAGPDGARRPQTQDRAALRAALGVLHFRAWIGEGFTRVVVATDSKYVVIGATEYLDEWDSAGWQTELGELVQDRDLWELMRDEIRGWESRGVQPMVWLIPIEWNAAAEELAKQGASLSDVQEKFTRIVGTVV